MTHAETEAGKLAREVLEDRCKIEDKPLEWAAVSAVLEHGLRHEQREPKDYLRKFLKIGRFFAYATNDDSWGEFEKELEIIVGRLVKAEQRERVLARAHLALTTPPTMGDDTQREQKDSK